MLSGGLFGEVLSKDVLDAKAYLSVEGSITLSTDCKKNEWKGCIGPAKAAVSMTVAKFHKQAFTYVFPNSKKCTE